MTAKKYWALDGAAQPGIAQLGLAILAGAGLVLALSPFSLLPVAFASFAILTLLLRCASPRRAVGLGYLFGLGQVVPGLFWITESFHFEADRFGWMALPAIVGLAGFLSVFPAFDCWVTARATPMAYRPHFHWRLPGLHLNGCGVTS